MRTNVTFFNKKLYDQYYDENIYDVVTDGKWTLDKLKAMTKDVCSDTNGDGKMDATDFYSLGFMSAATPLDAFVAALDLSITTKNADGIPDLSFYCERTVNAFEKLTDLVMKNPGTYTNPRSEAAGANSVFRQKFLDGGIIFNFTNNLETEYLRDMKDGYGILPLPKLDESQSGYYAWMNYDVNTMCVPVTNSDPTRTGIIIDALCYLSWRDVLPNYYNIRVSQKSLRNDDSIEMLKTIHNSLVYDAGNAYGWTLDLMNQVRSAIVAGNPDVASTIASNKSIVDENIQKTLDMIG